MRPPIVIKTNKALFEQYDSLAPGDIINCRIRLKPGEEHLLLDLAGRGITGIPSFTSQLCSRSKTFQTRLFSHHMLPGTSAVYTIHDLLGVISQYGIDGIGKVVLKQEGKNGGLGVLLFNSIEDIYTQCVTGLHTFPFVLQPFISDYRDIRVIIIGDYIEQYERVNRGSFRHNLHCGGTPGHYSLTEKQLSLCQTVMDRADFPYAHIDLMVTADNKTYLTEINLRGGLRGAAIDSRTYQSKIDAVQESLCRDARDKNFSAKTTP